MKRSGWVFLLLVATLYAVRPLCLKATDGFALTKLSAPLVHTPSLPFDESCLSQRFFYFTKGGQCYVFVSEDGNYVLKLFRASRLHALDLLSRLLPLQSVEKRRAKAHGSLVEAMESYALAGRHFQNETGLVGVYLGEGALETATVRIVDKLGIEHGLDPHRTPFVLQKRGASVKQQIATLMEKGDLTGAKAAISQLFALVLKAREKRMGDADPNLVKNFGFVEGEAMELDGGAFHGEQECALQKVSGSKEDLLHWLNYSYPELSPHLEEEYVSFVNRTL